MHRPLLSFVLSAAALFAAVLAGCSGGPSVEPNPMTAYSPRDYREQRALFLRPVKDKPDLADLKFSHEVQAETKPGETSDLAIHHNDPISIVVSDVYIPHRIIIPGWASEPGGPNTAVSSAYDDFAIDVVVMLDVQTSSDPGLQSFALWYERGVRPGQRLNFTSALVYSERNWNSRNQPYFKLRVMDVSKERNAETRAALDGLATTVGSLSAFFPHPAIPGAAAAIHAAGLIASNRANYPIVDYTPQFYADQFIKQAGPNDLALFARGSWMVVGRAPGQDESFWKTPLQLHLKTGEVLNAGSGKPIPIPYMRMTVATYDAVVPSVILDRSKALFTFLAEKRSGPDAFVNAITNSLVSGISAYQIHARFADARNMETLAELYKKANSSSEVDDFDRVFLRAAFARATGQSGKNWPDVTHWWETTGMNGSVDPKTGQWVPKPGTPINPPAPAGVAP
ncbi:MAG: hypothetical protein ACREJO_09825 [Phycisphaerales bacterium]